MQPSPGADARHVNTWCSSLQPDVALASTTRAPTGAARPICLVITLLFALSFSASGGRVRRALPREIASASTTLRAVKIRAAMFFSVYSDDRAARLHVIAA